MNRRQFITALVGSAAAAVILPNLPDVLSETATTTTFPGWAVAGESLRCGDVFTISGVYAVNPLTHAEVPFLQQFVITREIAAGDEVQEDAIWPKLLADGPYRNVSRLPTHDAVLIPLGMPVVSS